MTFKTEGIIIIVWRIRVPDAKDPDEKDSNDLAGSESQLFSSEPHSLIIILLDGLIFKLNCTRTNVAISYLLCRTFLLVGPIFLLVETIFPNGWVNLPIGWNNLSKWLGQSFYWLIVETIFSMGPSCLTLVFLRELVIPTWCSRSCMVYTVAYWLQ